MCRPATAELKTAAFHPPSPPGAKPLWQQPQFPDLFADTSVRRADALAAMRDTPLLDRLKASLDLVAQALGRLPSARPNEQRAAQAAQGAMLGGAEVIRQLPALSADPDRFTAFLRWFVERILCMRPGHAIALPGGWLAPGGGGHVLLHILACDAQGARPRPRGFSFTLRTADFVS